MRDIAAKVTAENRKVVLSISFDKIIDSLSESEVQELAGVLCLRTAFLSAAVDLLLTGSTESGTWFDSTEVASIRQRIASNWSDAARLAMAEELREEASAWRSASMAEQECRSIESAVRRLSRSSEYRFDDYDKPTISRKQLDDVLRAASEFRPRWDVACNDYRAKRCEEMYQALKYPEVTK